MQQSSATPKKRCREWVGKIVASRHSSSHWLLVSTVFGTVSPLLICILISKVFTGLALTSSTWRERRPFIRLNGKSPRGPGALLSEGQILPYYRKGTSRTKIRPSHVKIMVFRHFIWAVDGL